MPDAELHSDADSAQAPPATATQSPPPVGAHTPPPASSTADVKKPDDHHERMIVVEKRRGFVARWLRRLLALLIILLLLLGLGFLVITLVLRSSIPRSIAESVATRALRLDVGLGAVDIGWGGDVTIDDLAVRLPSRDGRSAGPLVLEVPRVVAELGPLPMVAFTALTGGTPTPDRVAVESPTLYMTQDESGTWTLPRAAELLAAGGGGGDGTTGPISLPPLPEIDLTGGTIIVRNNAGEERRVENLSVTGTEASPLVYTAQLEAPGVMQIEAELIPASGRQQEVQVRVSEIASVLEPYISLPSVSLEALWQGGFTNDGGVAGTLSFGEATDLAGISISGPLDIAATGEGTATVQPGDEPLTITGVPGVDGSVELIAGTVRTTPEVVEVDDLLLSLLGGQVLVDEIAYSLANQTATARVSFQDISPTPESSLTGTLQGDLWYEAFGEPRAQLALETSGRVGERRVETFSAAMQVYGKNYRDFSTLDVDFSIPEEVLIAGGAGETTPLPPTQGTVLVRLDDENPFIELASVETLGGAGSFDAHGRFYLPQGDPDDPATADEAKPAYYGLWVEAKDWPVQLPRMSEPLPLDVGAVVAGALSNSDDPDAFQGYNPGTANIATIYGSYGDIQLDGAGSYVINKPGDEEVVDPLQLVLVLTRSEPFVVVPSTQPDVFAIPVGGEFPMGEPGPDLPATDPPLIAGDIRTNLRIVGDPLAGYLVADGELVTDDFVLGPYVLGDLQSGIDAVLVDERLTVETTGAQVLGATLRLNADVPFDEAQPGVVHLILEDLELARVSQAAAISVGDEPVTGTADVNLKARLRGFDPGEIRATGEIHVDNLSTFAGTVADEVTLLPRFENKELTVPITLRRQLDLPEPPPMLAEDVEDLHGGPPADFDTGDRTLSLEVGFDLEQNDRVVIRDLRADGYPIELLPEALGGEVTGAAEVTAQSDQLLIRFGPGADPPGGVEPGLAVIGNVEAAIRVLTGPTPSDLSTLALLDLAIDADRTEVSLERLQGELPGIGTLEGGGTLELTDLPGRSNVWLQSTVELGPLADRLGLPDGGAGSLDMALSLQPTPGDRPKGEILADFAFSGRNARFRSVELDRGQVIAYLSRADRPDGSKPASEYDFTIITTERIRILAAGGVTEGYIKYRDRGENNGGRYAQATIDVRGAQASQLGPFIDEPEVRGDIDLNVIAYGSLDAPAATYTRPGEDVPVENPLPIALNGEGSLRVRDGRLRQFNLFAALLERVNIIPVQANDEVDADFRLEEGDFRISGGRAYVGGVEIRGNLTIRSLFAGEEAPISGQVVVLLQPLAAFNLPFFAQATDVLDAIQAQATAFNLRGTLGNPRPIPVGFDAVGNTLGALLGTNRRESE